MSYPMKLRGNVGVRGKRRLVTKTKWELSHGDAKSYWDKICNDIESKVSMTVRNPSSSSPILIPVISPPIVDSTTSSVGRDDTSIDDSSSRHVSSEILESKERRSIIEEAKSFSHRLNSEIATGLSKESVTALSNNEDSSSDRYDSSKESSGLTKVLKITKMVNEFLWSTRTPLQATSTKSKKIGLVTRKTNKNDRHDKSVTTSEKVSNSSSKDLTSERESLKSETTVADTKEKVKSDENDNSNKRSVNFRDNLKEIPENDYDKKLENVVVNKAKRARAPSLSIASALPSFGKVVISIEDTDSIENEAEYGKFFDTLNDVTSKDYRKTMELDGSGFEEIRGTGNFLEVPKQRSVEKTCYPIVEESKYQKESFESKLFKESQVLEKKYPLWPKRSLFHIFHALKTMKTGLRSKARIELDTNRFFSAPLETYSPSGRSSMSSNDRTAFENMNSSVSTSERNDDSINEGDDDGNGSRENIGESSSYVSVCERLMQNSMDHLSKDSENDAAVTRIDTDNVLDSRSGQANPSSFYNSWVMGKNKVAEKQRNKKISDRCFIGIPRLRRIFQRVKVDKCLACMDKSIGVVDQSRHRKITGISFDNDIDNNLVLREDELSRALDCNFSIENSFDQLYRDQYRKPVSKNKPPEESSTEEYTTRSFITDPAKDQVVAIDSEKFKPPVQETAAESLKPETSRSRTIVKSSSKILTSSKSLTTSMSERSRSISDQDDSDQGFPDAAGNDVRLEGGSTAKYLAPCHMPINLKPSLEPLYALKSKKSRSIRSRVASAEKSGNSDNDNDDDDSVYEQNVGRPPFTDKKKTLDADKIPTKQKFDKVQNIGKVRRNDIFTEYQLQTKEKVSSGESEEPKSTDIEIDNVAANNLGNIPILSDREVLEISANCLDKNMSTTEILQTLATEYSNRLSNRYSHKNRSSPSTPAEKNEKIAINLLTLLVDSKKYLNREKRLNDTPDLSFSSKQPNFCNSRQLRRILPLKSYNLVAPILGMAKWYPAERFSNLRDAARRVSKMERQAKLRQSALDPSVRLPSRVKQNVSFEKIAKAGRPKLNPYSLFLMKPRRKAVTWRPLTERDLEGYDPEATLKMRATKVTDKICEDFCTWLDSLAVGTSEKSNIDIEVLKDMFETDFKAEVCSTMQVSIKEMPMVPTAVAVARNCPDVGELALTRKHLVKDATAETKPKRTIGFDTRLPNDLKFIPPRNRVNEKWLQCENVPKDLETMEAVWKDITHLTSVKGFVKWLNAHPEVKRPKGLEHIVSSKKSLPPRKSVATKLQQLELELDQIQSLKVADNAPDAY